MTTAFSPSSGRSTPFSAEHQSHGSSPFYPMRFPSGGDTWHESSNSIAPANFSSGAALAQQSLLAEGPALPPRALPPAPPSRSFSAGHIAPAYPPRSGSVPTSMPMPMLTPYTRTMPTINHSPAFSMPNTTAQRQTPSTSAQNNRGLDLAEYLRLSNGIRALEYAEVELSPRREELHVLREQLNSATEEISALQHRSDSLLSKVREMRRFSLKRVKHAFTGDAHRNLEKKEQEYLSAQAQTERTERHIQELRDQIEQATEKIGKLEHDKQQLDAMRATLRQFVDQSFNGPTPECPEEDALETELSELTARYVSFRDVVLRDDAVHVHLQSARSSLADALSNVVEQLHRIESISIFGAITTNGYMQTAPMRASRQKLAEACYRQAQARVLDPCVPETIPAGLVDYENDLISSIASFLTGDLFTRDRMTRLYNALMAVVGQMDAVLDDHGRQAAQRNHHAHQVYAELQRKRDILTDLRIKVFERALVEGEQPPAYQDIAPTSTTSSP
ncbi:hypothetical protein BDF19DRAFT_433880 [Syncephalis fuscata]|nr:hypothetical protein BDF19DRAFT_433880 [Syncephalis fuscata]